jgi:predicted DNA-binding transcriptional regulator YafY
MSKSSAEMGKVQRQNTIKRLLSHTSKESALSISDITHRLNSEGLSVNRKTVERDIEDISLAHPLSEGGTNPRRYYFDSEFKLDFELVFDENQLQTIVLALQSLKQMSPGVLKLLCSEVEATLVSKLPKSLRKEFEHLKSLSNAAPTVLGESADIEKGVLQTVLLCLRKGNVFQCQYLSQEASGPSSRIRLFAPLKIHFVGTPYLYVYDCENDVIKMLRVSRIHHVVMTNIKVNIKRAKEINLAYVFGGYGKGSEKVINYTITCTSPMASKFREQKIHFSQKIEVIEGDLFKITFTVHDSFEVIRLLSQYGEFIKKIEPEEEYKKVKAIWKKGLAAA